MLKQVPRSISQTGARKIVWVRSSRSDLKAFPKNVRTKIGYALWVAQEGRKHSDVKPLRGFGGAGVVEIMTDYDGDTYRAVYTVRFSEAIYVIHVFQKKSKSGISTPRFEIELIRARLKYAELLHEAKVVRGAD
jgi:phage-related protein